MRTAWANNLPPVFWAVNRIGEVVVWTVILSIFNQLAKQQYRQSLKLCQLEEIVIIQVRGERVLSEIGWKEGDNNQRKQEVKGVKRVEKNAQES